ncbi:MAG: pyridoxamine 5'-phosphate oxidase [Bacteroidetes bacterium]|nr:pyridoxamine 5'-phosphate oxidase [Bacteroidota bacterium]
MNRDLGDKRREYGWDRLEKSDLPKDPMELFSDWLEQALQSRNPDPTAMTLSTVERNGQPSSRIVLLKKVEEDKLVFYTNYHSRKSREIRAKTRVAVHFYWPELERQVNITGTARPIDDVDSDHYFKSRPYDSKITAWASPQSEVIPNSEYLEKEFEKYREKYHTADEIPRPAYWGGYAIHPSRIEFWQGGQRRLHDRIEYTKKDERWSSVRLAP